RVAKTVNPYQSESGCPPFESTALPWVELALKELEAKLMSQPDPALAQWALDEARRRGATATEVLLAGAESIAAGARLGEVEKLKSSRERRLGMRVFVDHASATASTAEMERDSLEGFIESTVAMARLTAPDPFSGLPEPKLQAQNLPDLELTDSERG